MICTQSHNRRRTLSDWSRITRNLSTSSFLRFWLGNGDSAFSWRLNVAQVNQASRLKMRQTVIDLNAVGANVSWARWTVTLANWPLFLCCPSGFSGIWITWSLIFNCGKRFWHGRCVTCEPVKKLSVFLRRRTSHVPHHKNTTDVNFNRTVGGPNWSLFRSEFAWHQTNCWPFSKKQPGEKHQGEYPQAVV